MKRKEVEIGRGMENTNFGLISKIIFPNKSVVYISNRGWTLEIDGKSITIPYDEINVAIKESIKQGYVAKYIN